MTSTAKLTSLVPRPHLSAYKRTSNKLISCMREIQRLLKEDGFQEVASVQDQGTHLVADITSCIHLDGGCNTPKGAVRLIPTNDIDRKRFIKIFNANGAFELWDKNPGGLVSCSFRHIRILRGKDYSCMVHIL